MAAASATWLGAAAGKVSARLITLPVGITTTRGTSAHSSAEIAVGCVSGARDILDFGQTDAVFGVQRQCSISAINWRHDSLTWGLLDTGWQTRRRGKLIEVRVGVTGRRNECLLESDRHSALYPAWGHKLAIKPKAKR